MAVSRKRSCSLICDTERGTHVVGSACGLGADRSNASCAANHLLRPHIVWLLDFEHRPCALLRKPSRDRLVLPHEAGKDGSRLHLDRDASGCSFRLGVYLALRERQSPWAAHPLCRTLSFFFASRAAWRAAAFPQSTHSYPSHRLPVGERPRGRERFGGRLTAVEGEAPVAAKSPCCFSLSHLTFAFESAFCLRLPRRAQLLISEGLSCFFALTGSSL